MATAYRRAADEARLVSAKGRLWLIAGGSWLFSMIVLHRWLFTDLGEKSFGRVWMFFDSWFDFGFTRRGLVGTVLTETHINQLFGNEYVLAYVLYSVLLTGAYLLVVFEFLRRPQAMSSAWFQAAIFFSPALFIHLGHATGSLDLIVVLLVIAILFHARALWLLVALVVAAVLVHELFVFMLPAVIALKAVQARSRPEGSPLATSIFIAAAGTTAVAFVVGFGRLQVDGAAYEHLMAQRMPLAAGEHPHWSGLFELSSSSSDNAGLGFEALSGATHAWLWVLIPTAYALLCIGLLFRFARAALWFRWLLVFFALLPLAAMFIASDFYRWVSMSAIVALLAMLVLVGINRLRLPTWASVTLTAFVVVAPFGGVDYLRPFPMHQMVIERILG